MKRFAIFFIFIFAIGTLMAQKKLETKQIDEIWEKAPELKMEKTTSDGMEIYRSVDSANKSFRMVYINLPGDFETQGEKIFIDDDNIFCKDLSESYRVVEKPRVIDGNIVLLLRIGMYNPEFHHSYFVLPKDKCEGYQTAMIHR